MAETVDDITMNYFENDQQLVKELDKVILTKGEYGTEKYAIRRYQKREGTYRPKSKFNISSADQAQKLIDGLTQWIKEDAE